MFSVILPPATRRACSNSPESLALGSLIFIHRFATSPRTELARNPPGSGTPFEAHRVVGRTEYGVRRIRNSRDASGPARRAYRLRKRPSSQIRQSPPPPEVSSSNEDEPYRATVGASRKHQASTSHEDEEEWQRRKKIMRFLSRFSSHIATGNTIRDLLCTHNRETINLMRDAYDVDTGMGTWLKTQGLKETLKMQMDQSTSQSEVMQHNIQKIEDVLDGGIEKILKSTVNRGPQRPRGAAKTKRVTARLVSADPIEEHGESYDLKKTDSEPAKTSEEDRKGFGPDDPEFLSWLRQLGGRKRREADTPSHPHSATEAESQQKFEEPVAQDANQEQPASMPVAEEKPINV